MAIPHFVAQAYSFVDEAEKLGARVILYDAGEHKNVAKQVSQMDPGGDRLTIGAVQALLAQGKKPGDVIVTIVDYNDDTEHLVREGLDLRGDGAGAAHHGTLGIPPNLLTPTYASPGTTPTRSI